MRNKTLPLSSFATAIIAVSLLLLTETSAQTYKVIHDFANAPSDGAHPVAGMIFDAQGNFYGTTTSGGILDCSGLSGCGTVFQLTPNSDGSWQETVISQFEAQQPYGGEPSAPVVLDRQGNVYGTLSCGFDCFGSMGGTVFQLIRGPNGNWIDRTVASYWDSQTSTCFGGACGLTFDRAGHLYLVSNVYSLFGSGEGAVLELGHQAVFGWYTLLLYSFSGGNDGGGPTNGLIYDAAGQLYGTTSAGGSAGLGVVYKVASSLGSPHWKETVLHTFQGSGDGAAPAAGVSFDTAGNLYGTTSQGGTAGLGTVYELTPNSDGTWSEAVLYSFQGGSDGSSPNSAISLDAAGNLYGTAAGGTYGQGVVFRLMRSSGGPWTESVLYSFTGGTDGGNPNGGVTIDASGNLYGTAAHGGAYPTCSDEPYCGGVAYKITP